MPLLYLIEIGIVLEMARKGVNGYSSLSAAGEPSTSIALLQSLLPDLVNQHN